MDIQRLLDWSGISQATPLGWAFLIFLAAFAIVLIHYGDRLDADATWKENKR